MSHRLFNPALPEAGLACDSQIASQNRSALKARNRTAQGEAVPPKVATRNPGYSVRGATSPERAAQPVSPFQNSHQLDRNPRVPLRSTLGCLCFALLALEPSHRIFNPAPPKATLTCNLQPVTCGLKPD